MNKLNLQPHPEGGMFKEIYKSDIYVEKNILSPGFSDRRSLVTSIYYMLTKDEVSRFHKLKADEIWHFLDGSPLLLHILDNSGNLKTFTLGNDIHHYEQPVLIIPHDNWFAAEVKDKSTYSLVSCTVSPGFEYNDLEFAQRKKLLEQYPSYKELIKRFTKE